MTKITNVVVQASGLEKKAINTLNEYLVSRGYNPFHKVDDVKCGGNDFLNVELYVAACTEFSSHMSGLKLLFEDIDWEYPELTVMIITGERDVAHVFQPNL